MQTYSTDFVRLALLIQRILDTEVLSDVESAPLSAATNAARQLLEEGNPQAARDHVEHLIQLTQLLLEGEALAQMDGQAVINTANRILNSEIDKSD